MWIKTGAGTDIPILINLDHVLSIYAVDMGYDMYSLRCELTSGDSQTLAVYGSSEECKQGIDLICDDIARALTLPFSGADGVIIEVGNIAT